MTDKFEIPAKILAPTIKLTKDIVKLFEENDIQYWAEGGSLLGCIREKGQIKHDDDADLAVFSKDMFKVLMLQPKIREMGYVCGYYNNLFKIHYPSASRYMIDGYYINFPTVDIFEYKEKKGEIILAGTNHKKLWPNAKHNVKDFFPLIPRQYEDIMIMTPNNPIPYFEGLYGDWKTPKNCLEREGFKNIQK